MDSPGPSNNRRSAPGLLKARTAKLDTRQRRQLQLRLLQQEAWELQALVEQLQVQRLHHTAVELMVVHQEVLAGMCAKVLRLQEAGSDCDARDENSNEATTIATAQAPAAATASITMACGASPRNTSSDGDAPAASPAGGNGASPACRLMREDPALQRMCDQVLQQYPLLDALDKVDVVRFAHLQHAGVVEFAAEWRAQMSELALLVSCGGHTDTSQAVSEVLGRCLCMAKISFLFKPDVMMQLVGFNIVTGQREAPPGPEHWRAVVAAAQLSEWQVALTKALVGFVGPRVAAAERKRQQVAEAAADAAGSMLSALSSDGGRSTSSFRSSGSAFRSMVGELEKHGRTWRVEAPMVGAIGYLLEPHQLAALFLRAMPFYPNLFFMLDAFTGEYGIGVGRE